MNPLHNKNLISAGLLALSENRHLHIFVPENLPRLLRLYQQGAITDEEIAAAFKFTLCPEQNLELQMFLVQEFLDKLNSGEPLLEAPQRFYPDEPENDKQSQYGKWDNDDDLPI